MKKIITDTMGSCKMLHQNQFVLYKNGVGKAIQASILSPGNKKSLIRYAEGFFTRERRIDNSLLLPVKPT